jgi:predicted DNA-binding protein YlxM (UPF0122 family)
MQKTVHQVEVMQLENKEAQFVCAMAQLIDIYKSMLTPEQMEKSILWAGQDYSHQ